MLWLSSEGNDHTHLTSCVFFFLYPFLQSGGKNLNIFYDQKILHPSSVRKSEIKLDYSMFLR